MQTHAQAIEPLLAAVKAALAAATPVTNLLAGGSAAIHDGEAPVPTSGEPLPSYLVLTSPAGEDESVFMKIGGTVRRQIDVWAATEPLAVALCTAVSVVLDGVTLTLIGGASHISGLTRTLGVFRDPGRRHLYHGVIQYEALVR